MNLSRPRTPVTIAMTLLFAAVILFTWKAFSDQAELVKYNQCLTTKIYNELRVHRIANEDDRIGKNSLVLPEPLPPHQDAEDVCEAHKL